MHSWGVSRLNAEARSAMKQKGNGAVNVHALVAPPSGNGSDGLFIVFLLLSAFPLNRLLAKFPHKRGNI